MTVKISIHGDGLSYEKETDLQKAGQIIVFLNAEAASTSSHGAYQAIQAAEVLPGTPESRKSPRQALIESEAKTNIEKIVVLADYVCRRDGVTTFSPKEIQLSFKKAGEPLPKNFTRDFTKAIQSGYVLEGDDKGVYLLTDLGVDALRDGFSAHSAPKVKSKATVKSRKRTNSQPKGAGSTVRDEVKELEITPDLSGYPGYWSISTKGMRIVWLLAFADSVSLDDGLTPAEISFMSTRLKDQIKHGDFTALTKSAIKKGYMTSPSSRGMSKILKKGEDALKGLVT